MGGACARRAVPAEADLGAEVRTECSSKVEVTVRASVSMEKLWGMDFSTGHPQGQWRNDVFNEWGAIVNCSGDICDGLWINGSPVACGSSGGNCGGADVSVKRTTVEQILTLQPMKKDPMPEQVDIS